jgi:hypothetical protein
VKRRRKIMGWIRENKSRNGLRNSFLKDLMKRYLVSIRRDIATSS